MYTPLPSDASAVSLTGLWHKFCYLGLQGSEPQTC
jgi:hypothetical protein